MALPPLVHPRVSARPTLETAIWFLQLRWVAVAGQLLTMAVVGFGFNIDLPTSELLTFIGVTAVTNLFYWWWLSRLHRGGLQPTECLPSDVEVSSLMLTDIVVLTGMLYLSAGIANPFALCYFVNIAVAGAIITPAWAWAVWGTTVAGVCLLLVQSMPIEALSSDSIQSATPGEEPIWTIPKLGFFVSFATCSGVITYFITVLTGELRRREQALQEAEDARVRNRQLEGLATLATGAAHELATPLSTIAVVAKELSRVLDKYDSPDSAKEDIVLIRSEVDECRKILDRMTSAAGDAAGERLQAITIRDLLSEAMLGVKHPETVQIEVSRVVKDLQNLLPVQAAAQAIRNLIQNARDASSPEATIRVRVDADQDSSGEPAWLIQVTDTGHGMTPEVLERIGQPFFTTKEPGRGMGLGLYLTENVIRRLNGEITFESEEGVGTTARVVLPTKRD